MSTAHLSDVEELPSTEDNQQYSPQNQQPASTETQNSHVFPKVDLSREAFRQVLEGIGSVVKSEHEHRVRASLSHARYRSHQRGAQANTSDVPESRPNNFQIRYPYKGQSPFADIKVKTSGTTLTKGGRQTKASTTELSQLGHYFLKQGKTVEEYVESHNDTPFRDTNLAIPPYTNYIRIERNILVDDDNTRVSIPYFGEGHQIDEEYEKVEDRISEHVETNQELNRLSEKAKQYIPFLDEVLQRLGLDVDSVLDYLWNDKKPSTSFKASKVLQRPQEGYLKYGYYSSSDDSDTTSASKTSEMRPKKIYREAKSLIKDQGSTEEKINRAALLCSEFSTLFDFSFWHVIKGRAQVMVEEENLSKSLASGGPFSLSTYAGLVCLICKSHDCPEHGEYGSYGDDKNQRIHVNHQGWAKNQEDWSSTIDSPVKARANPRIATSIERVIGLDEDGTVSGLPWSKLIVDQEAQFLDGELCAENCFWPKANRTRHDKRPLPTWSENEVKIMQTLRPAYDDYVRSPCLLSETGHFEKSCFEIFKYMLDNNTIDPQISTKLRNVTDTSGEHQSRRRPLDYWLSFEDTYLHHQREPFIPCNHIGPCSEETDCPCFDLEITCETTCACSDNCTRKFKGCRCASKNRACFKDDSCECFRLNRECDPDLCRSCGAREILNPLHRNKDSILKQRCSNVYIQRNVPKHTLLGYSRMMADGGKSGWGLYMAEICRKGQYVGEYVGEIVSSRKAEMRGIIYDKRTLSYLFDLNQGQTLDSTLIGGKLRFVNHQPGSKANLVPRTTLCNGVQRIGMFASRGIAIGEELFFDYGEDFTSKHQLIELDTPDETTHTGHQSNSSIKSTQVSSKITLSKNGYRIGRPPKHKNITVDHLLRLAGQVSSRSRPGSLISRKRSLSTMWSNESNDVPIVTLPEESSDNDSKAESPAERMAIDDIPGPLDPTTTNNNSNSKAESPERMTLDEMLGPVDMTAIKDGSDSDFNSEDARPRRIRRKMVRKRRSDFGVKRGPRKKPEAE